MGQLEMFKNTANKKIPKSHMPVILSASRMTDMPKYYPGDLIEKVAERKRQHKEIHTLVLWSKHPQALLSGNLNNFIKVLIKEGTQVFFQCTITGMGERTIGRRNDGKPLILEPNVPPMEDSLDCLREIIGLLKNPLRVKLRIDPLVKLRKEDGTGYFSNFDYAEKIVDKAASLGIKYFTFSLLEAGVHIKVDRAFSKTGWSIEQISTVEREEIATRLKYLAQKYGVDINPCCVRNLPESRCIDGYLLEALHDSKRPVRKDEPRKRELCGCTHSIDLGGWPPKKCFSGCLYCYANPKYF